MHHTLAVSYLGLGAWDKALPQADAALALARQRLGEHNLTTALMYHTVGEVLFKQEKPKEAIPNYRHSLDIYQELAPTDSMRYTIQNNLSSSELNAGLRDEALRDTQAAVNGFRSLPGHEPDLGLALCDLATTYRQLGNVELEEKTGKESIDVLRRLSDPPVNFGTCLNNRALLLQDIGHNDESLVVITEAITFTRQRVGNTYTELANMLSIRSDLQRMLHHYTEARADIEEALAVALKNYPRDHEWPQYILYMYGKLHCDPGVHEYEQGIAKLKESLQKRRPNLPPDDLQIAAMDFALGRCLVPLHREKEAEPPLAEAIRIRAKRFGKDAAATKRATDLYRQVLSARSLKVNPDEALALALK